MVRGGSLKPSSTYSYREPLHEKAVFQYLKLLLIMATLAVGVLILFNMNQITGAVVADTAQTIDVNDFLAKLTAHAEMGAYVGVAPLGINQIDNNNIANLQSKITGLDSSFIGHFIIEYTDAIVIYDYNNDAIKWIGNLQQQAQLPGDFFTKLNTHPEVAGLENEQPIGGQLDQASLDTLMQQFPNVYANAKVGDFLLRYSVRLIIYDYNNDLIVNAVNLG